MTRSRSRAAADALEQTMLECTDCFNAGGGRGSQSLMPLPELCALVGGLPNPPVDMLDDDVLSVVAQHLADRWDLPSLAAAACVSTGWRAAFRPSLWALPSQLTQAVNNLMSTEEMRRPTLWRQRRKSLLEDQLTTRDLRSAVRKIQAECDEGRPHGPHGIFATESPGAYVIVPSVCSGVTESVNAAHALYDSAVAAATAAAAAAETESAVGDASVAATADAATADAATADAATADAAIADAAADAAGSESGHAAEGGGWASEPGSFCDGERATHFLSRFIPGLRGKRGGPVLPALRMLDPATIDEATLVLVARRLRTDPRLTSRQQRSCRAAQLLVSWAQTVVDEGIFFRHEPEAREVDLQLRRLCSVVANLSSSRAARSTAWGTLRKRLIELGLEAFIAQPHPPWAHEAADRSLAQVASAGSGGGGERMARRLQFENVA